MKRVSRLAVILILLLITGGIGRGFVLEDPTELYSVQIPNHWVYQAHQSNDLLIVFYGQGSRDLLYFEQLLNVFDADVLSFAQRSLELFAVPGGLDRFELHEPLAEDQVAGKEAVSCLYSYRGSDGGTVWEYRVFLLLPGERGFTISFSDSEQSVVRERAVLNQILEKWRWLF